MVYRDARRIRHGHRAAHQRYARAKVSERCGYRMALPAAAAVRDVANRVNRLMRRTTGDEGVLARERLRAAEHGVDRGKNRGRLRETAGTIFIAGHRAFI